MLLLLTRLGEQEGAISPSPMRWGHLAEADFLIQTGELPWVRRVKRTVS